MPRRQKIKSIAEDQAGEIDRQYLKVSFEYLDWSCESFFVHGMEKGYYEKLFNCMHEIAKAKEHEITQQNHPSLVPKSIFNTKHSSESSFPDSVHSKLKNQRFIETRDDDAATEAADEMISRAFEVCVAKNYGRVHGFVWNSTFHVVWFDPAHNLYPSKYGVRSPDQFAQVKSFCPEELLRLKGECQKLQDEYDELFEEFAKYKRD